MSVDVIVPKLWVLFVTRSMYVLKAQAFLSGAHNFTKL